MGLPTRARRQDPGGVNAHSRRSSMPCRDQVDADSGQLDLIATRPGPGDGQVGVASGQAHQQEGRLT